MKIQKVRMLIIAIGTVFLGAGLARSYRQVVNNTSVNEVQQHSVGASNAQASKSQRLRLAEADGLEFERRVVKGVPLSAVLVIEVTQTNSNIDESKRLVSLIYRDEQGRTRRDRMSANITETDTLAKQLPLITTINDPVGGYSYILENHANVAWRSAFSGQWEEKSNSLPSVNQPALSSVSSGEIIPVPVNSDMAEKLIANTKPGSTKAIPEPLGQREIEGFTAEGTRITMTIPAGVNGQEHPIVTTVERWYSQDLKVVLLIERSDPRFGKSTLRLSGIRRNDPNPGLFTVPTGFKITPK